MRSRETRDCVALFFLLQLPFLFLPFPLRYTIFIFHPAQNTALREKRGGFPGMRMCNRALWPPGCCFAFLLLSLQHPFDGPQCRLSHLPQDENTLSSSCGGTSLNYFPLTAAARQRALFAQTSGEKDREKNQV